MEGWIVENDNSQTKKRKEVKLVVIDGSNRQWQVVFSKLETLNIKGLDNVEFLFSPSMIKSLAQLRDLRVSYCKKMEVAFPKLEALEISGLDNFEMIWDNKVAVDSFPKLKTLCVVDCNKLVSVVCSFILRQLLSLERLDARRCGSLEIVFELQTLNRLDGHPIALPLRELTVSRLPKLKYLIQLEKLAINECGIVETIKSEEGLFPKFVFPILTSLELECLRELKCLYTRTHTSHWPALKTLKVHGCDKVEILASHSENEVQLDKLPLFLIEKGAFPNLQELTLDLSEQMEIWHGHFNDREFFCKLRLLKLRHLSHESSISICRFVESSTNLEELVVCESYLEDPSNNEEAIEGTIHDMKVILPFSRYIRHLQTLDVSHCDELSKMFRPTIAENLVTLIKLRISNCRILTEVINDEKGGEGCMVAFNQLKSMELDGLIGLRSFSWIHFDVPALGRYHCD
ncbi:hypothetical protein EUGRSUZ_G00723 [Eucalyptus grandis]|uniref:Uncharacterized protein n=2 Tax=Eucalyptus grandis TaxID=71139 RepID=A0ACC3K215_EUCGR|nr:hypothetical protein EUGRSUZ_G00723 [Eucalyptus grandis]